MKQTDRIAKLEHDIETLVRGFVTMASTVNQLTKTVNECVEIDSILIGSCNQTTIFLAKHLGLPINTYITEFDNREENEDGE